MLGRALLRHKPSRLETPNTLSSAGFAQLVALSWLSHETNKTWAAFACVRGRRGRGGQLRYGGRVAAPSALTHARAPADPPLPSRRAG
jgi:hypothetical protein